MQQPPHTSHAVMPNAFPFNDNFVWASNKLFHAQPIENRQSAMSSLSLKAQWEQNQKPKPDEKEKKKKTKWTVFIYGFKSN